MVKQILGMLLLIGYLNTTQAELSLSEVPYTSERVKLLHLNSLSNLSKFKTKEKIIYYNLSKEKLIKTTLTKDNAITFQWEDGREAKLLYTLVRTEDLILDLDFKGNSCIRQEIIPKCQLKESVQIYQINLAWTKHHNPQKIGLPVNIKNTWHSRTNGMSKTNEGLAFSKIIYYTGSDLIKSSPYSVLNPQYIEKRPSLTNFKCENYDWLKSTNTQILNMSFTKLSDNQEQESEVEWHQKTFGKSILNFNAGQQTAELTHITDNEFVEVNDPYTTRLPFLHGDYFGWLSLNTNGEVCETYWKVDHKIYSDYYKKASKSVYKSKYNIENVYKPKSLLKFLEDNFLDNRIPILPANTLEQYLSFIFKLYSTELINSKSDKNIQIYNVIQSEELDNETK